ncbi:MAG: right-handed parallel beta-helix repeat-containing protein [Deltaproteobacteria bacterium]|nr:right-handed parallel beta-helix repeat-containing protein [Deltaproteobacteria bacterium]
MATGNRWTGLLAASLCLGVFSGCGGCSVTSAPGEGEDDAGPNQTTGDGGNNTAGSSSGTGSSGAGSSGTPASGTSQDVSSGGTATSDLGASSAGQGSSLGTSSSGGQASSLAGGSSGSQASSMTAASSAGGASSAGTASSLASASSGTVASSLGTASSTGSATSLPAGSSSATPATSLPVSSSSAGGATSAPPGSSSGSTVISSSGTPPASSSAAAPSSSAAQPSSSAAAPSSSAAAPSSSAAAPSSSGCPAPGTVAGSGCTGNGTACDTATGNILTCQAAGGCSTWVQTSDCVAQQLVCSTAAGAPACLCAPNSTGDLYVDSVNGSDAVTAGLRPTGVADPAGCRFGTLTYALSQVTTGHQVIATGAGGSGMTFTSGSSLTNSETFPLNVPADVALTTSDAPLNPARYTIVVNSGGLGVTLADGAELSGFTVAAGAGVTTPVALATCTAGSVLVDTVAMTGMMSGAITVHGVQASGTCAATVLSFTPTGLSGSGVRHVSTGASTITGSTFVSNTRGIHQTAGTVTVASGTTITASTGRGVLVDPGNGTAATFFATGLTVQTSSAAGIGLIPVTGATVTATLDNCTLTGNGRGNPIASGVEISGAVTATLTGVTATGNSRAGLQVGGGTVTVVGGAFDANGPPSSSVPGVSGGMEVIGGTVTITGPTTAGGNNQNGVAQAGGTITAADLTTGRNQVAGVAIVGGSFSGDRLVSSNNRGRGVHVLLGNSPGMALTNVRLTDPTLSLNTLQGMDVQAPSILSPVVGLHGIVSVTDNGLVTGSLGTAASGLRFAGGTVTLGGNVGDKVDVAGNGLFGIHLAGAQVTMTAAAVHENGMVIAGFPIGGGLAVTPETGVAMNVSGGEISRNNGYGVVVSRAPALAGGQNSLLLTGADIHDNPLNGVRVAPPPAGYGLPNGPVAASFNSLSIHHNDATGVYLENTNGGGTAVALTTNDIFKNGTTGVITPVGGLEIHNQISLGTFAGNKLHDNAGHQMRVQQNVTVDLSSPTGGTCGARNNEFYCYGPGAMGLQVMGAPGLVTAGNNGWHNDPAQSGTDYSVGVLPSPWTECTPSPSPRVCMP